MKHKGIIGSSLKLIALTFLSRIMGLLRSMVKAAFLGTSALSDAFTIAFMIPNLLRRLFAEGSIAVAFVPTFKTYLDSKKDDKLYKTQEFLDCVFTAISFLVVLIVTAGILLAPFIVQFFGTDPRETLILTRMMFPYLAFISLASLLQGILNTHRIFTPSGFVPILFNLCVILSTIFLSRWFANPARAMAFGVLLGGMCQIIFQWPFVKKLGYRLRFVPLSKAFANKGTKNIGRLIGPTIIGMAAYQINNLISSIMASRVGQGVASSLDFSLRLQELLLGVFAVSVGTILLTEFSHHAGRKEWAIFSDRLSVSMKFMLYLTIPVSAFTIIFAREIVAFLFQTQAFDAHSVTTTANALRFHSLGLPFIAINRILTPAFYAQQKSIAPTIAGVLAIGINIFLVLLWGPNMKEGGIALAVSVASAANTIFLLIALTKNKNIPAKKIFLAPFLYLIKLSVVTGVLVGGLIYGKDFLMSYFLGFSNRFLEYGVPLFLISLAFFSLCTLLLYVLGDRLFSQIKQVSHFKSKD